jgi:Immunity protein 26
VKQNYTEGTWFAVPLRKGGGFGLGVVARAAAKKAIILCYFFGPRRESVPKLQDVSTLNVSSSILVLRSGDLGLIRGDWPILGTARSWNRSDWPTPVFIRREPLPPFRNWRVYYSETDPGVTVKEEIETSERPDLPLAGSSGYGAVEIKLTRLLAEDD